MSATTTPPPAVSPIAEWGGVAVSILSLLLFVATLIVSYLSKNDTAFMLLVGAVVSMGTTTINYWLGSSRGSVAKDATISAIATGAPTPTQAAGPTGPAA